jgi:hypothetical protein
VKTCPACTSDPDPRGPSACHACRELNREFEAVALAPLIPILPRLVSVHAVDDRLYIVDEARLVPDLSDAHVDRVAHHLFRTFDDASAGRAPLHDFEHWRVLAREAIQIGAVVS